MISLCYKKLVYYWVFFSLGKSWTRVRVETKTEFNYFVILFSQIVNFCKKILNFYKNEHQNNNNKLVSLYLFMDRPVTNFLLKPTLIFGHHIISQWFAKIPKKCNYYQYQVNFINYLPQKTKKIYVIYILKTKKPSCKYYI